MRIFKRQETEIGLMLEADDEGEDKGWDILETGVLRIITITGTSLVQDGEGSLVTDMINEYRVLKVLGKGSFGLVKKCQREVQEPPYREFALKIMSKAKLRKVKETIRDEEGFPMRIDGLQKLQNEIQLMRHLFHRNVSILFEVCRLHYSLDSGIGDGRSSRGLSHPRDGVHGGGCCYEFQLFQPTLRILSFCCSDPPRCRQGR
jgi:serine/threonine protein kinase